MSVVRVLKLTIAYDGTRFVGWQRQAEGESIQGLLEDALGRFEGGHVTVNGAGRTDAGVHALGQVASARVNCRHEVTALLRGLNRWLPEEVRVVSVEDALPEFHARFSARGKSYRYQIRNDLVMRPFERLYSWHVPERLDIAAMQTAAELLEGRHDFSAFRSLGTETPDAIRTITRSVVRRDDTGLLLYEVTGEGFLRYMVRTVVGTLVDVGRGWRPPADVAALLASGVRADAGATAPPHGLFLVGVDYD